MDPVWRPYGLRFGEEEGFKAMMSAIASAWSLFLGMSFIMLGNGLQSTLLGVRSVQEGFSTTWSGVVMAGYFAGFLIGSIVAPKLVTRVGHIRVFAALASLASTAILLHLLMIEPVTWTAMRVLTGFSYAGLYVVAESWINDRATNETRGQMLAFYMIVVLGSMAGGQYLLNLSDPASFELFIVSSVLISLALIPILLSHGKPPEFDQPTKVGFFELYRLTPLGVISAIGVGLAHGTLISLAAVYAETIGLSLEWLTLFTSMIFLGGLMFQWPLASLSDKIDRRKALTGVSLAAAVVAFLGFLFADLPDVVRLTLIWLFGGMSLPLYSITVAHMNDHLEPGQRVAASGTLYIYYGIAATLGPIGAAFFMDHSTPSAFYLFMAIAHAGVVAFALYRMTRRPAVPLEEQG
ncbi:MAG: MFS transporter, partial [Kiloniellales bacterium]|nr:MFS transporter [Kiloniellales bacterium]